MMTLKFEANTHCIMTITNTLLCSKAILFSFNLSLNSKLLDFIYFNLYLLLLTLFNSMFALVYLNYLFIFVYLDSFFVFLT